MVKVSSSIGHMLQEYIYDLEKSIKVDKAILFGSRALGTELKNSDIDIIIISDDFENMNFLKRLEFLELSWKYSNPIEAFGYTGHEYDNMSNQINIVAEAKRYGKQIYPRIL